MLKMGWKKQLASLAAAGMLTGVLVPGMPVARAEITGATGAAWSKPDTLSITKIASYSVGQTNKDGGVAEIVKFNKDNGKFYLVNGSSVPPTLEIVPLTSTGGVLAKERSIDISALAQADGFQFGDLTSVDINTASKRIAVAVQEKDAAKNGKLLLLDYDGNLVKVYEAGVQPDMVKFTSNGRYLLSADEGEPRTTGVDPEGSVTIIDTQGNTIDHVKFDNPALIDNSVHIRGASDSTTGQVTGSGPKTAAVTDLEPEFIALSADESVAYVSLQENNAIARINIAAKSVLDVKGLGYKDHSLPTQSLDLVKDSTIKLENVPFLSMYMPDGIATYTVNSSTYLLTANEGDETDWTGRKNGTTIGSLKASLNPASDAAAFLSGKTEYDGVTVAADMDKDNVYLYGGRSFSIWNASSMAQVYDSGNDFESIVAERLPASFNASNSKTAMDDRSPKKGPEPEYVTAGKVGDKVYAFVGLERIGGVMTYDVTDPAHPAFANYINTRAFTPANTLATDTGPEGLEFIPASDSPTGYPLLLVANEVGGTVTVLQLNVEPKVEPGNIKVQILGLSDLHGNIDSKFNEKDSGINEDLDSDSKKDKDLGGMQYMASYIRAKKAENPNTLIAHSGDMIGASPPLSALFHDEPTIEVLNQIRFDIGAVGNHEFDEGTAELMRMYQGGAHLDGTGSPTYGGMDFPILGANVKFKATHQPALPAYAVKEVGGAKIGFIGVVTEETPRIVIPTGIADLEFTDAAQAVNEAAAALKSQGVKAIVVLAHMSADQQSDGSYKGEAVDLANHVDDEVDVIVAAHNHKRVNTTVDGKLVVAAWEYSKALIDIDLEIDRTTGDVVSKTGQMVYNFRTVEPQADIQAIITTYKEKAGPKLQAVVGQNVNAMVQSYPGKGKDVNGDFPLGSLIADGMKAEMQADFAMMNGGGVRAPLDAGPITWEELFSIQPFSNTLIRVEVTGAQLREIVEAQLGTNPNFGPDSHVGGFRYTWTQVGTKRKVIDLTFPNGTPIPADGKYTLVVNSFMFTSNDARYVKMHTYGKNVLQGPEDLQGTVNFVKNYAGPISYASEGRIREIVAAAPVGKDETVVLGSAPVSLTVPTDATGAAVQVTTTLSGAVKQGTLPSVDVKAATAIGEVSVMIPQGTVVSASAEWDGKIKLPEILPNSRVTVANGSVSAVIELGSSNVALTFDKAVRILLPNQAGRAAGYVAGGVFKPITATISADTQAAADQELPAGGEASIAVGSDLVIWTKHFTQFVSYAPVSSGTPVSTPSTPAADPVQPKPAEKPTEKPEPAKPEKPPAAPNAALSDIQGHWAENGIRELVKAGAIDGYADGTFDPEKRITRAEFATVLVKAFKLQAAGSKSFSDISGHWAKTYIETAAGNGLVSGYSDTQFGPDDLITREQMAVMVVRAAKLSEGASAKAFSDQAAMSDWAQSSIAAAVSAGLIDGYGDGSFKPKAQTTRAEAVTLILKALKHV